MQHCQGRISSETPPSAGTRCQVGFIHGAAWKSCSLRSTLSPFTATSLGKHMAVVKAQLSVTFSSWKENTEAVGRLGSKSPSCQSVCAAIQRDPHHQRHLLFHSTPVFVTQCHCRLQGQLWGKRTEPTRCDLLRPDWTVHVSVIGRLTGSPPRGSCSSGGQEVACRQLT